MRLVAAFCITTLLLMSGCKAAHQPGPLISLYQKNGGPSYETSPGVYDRAVVDKFFRSHAGVIDSFVKNGVCNQTSDPRSDEAAQNSLICQSATAASMENSFRKYQSGYN